MKNLRFHPIALLDFDESYTYYEKESKDLAEKFASEIDQKLKEINSNPKRARLIKGNYRIVNIKTFPFQIIYSYSEALSRISISAIHHTSKHPQKRFRKF